MDNERIAVLESRLGGVKDDTEKILRCLEGDGINDGLVTRTALNKQAIKRLWWLAGITTTAFIAGGVGLFFKAAAMAGGVAP